MKKFTILLLFISFSAFVFAQDVKPLHAVTASSLLDRKSNSSFLPPSHNTNTGKKPNYRGLIVDTLGSAGNAYTTLSSECHNLISDSALNTIVFIHRNDNSISGFGNDISWYRYDISKDGGATWTNNIGPVNPNCKDSVKWYNSRFPQVSIQEHVNNTTGFPDVDSSYMVYLGAWHDNTSASTNSIWNGIVTGAEQLTGNPASDKERDSTMNNGNTLIASSMCKGKPNEFWAMDQEQSGYTNDSLIIVYKGVWDDQLRDVNWTVFKKLNPQFFVNAGSTAQLTPLIAFDPTGMIGWIGTCADFGGTLAGSLTPYFYNTTDGGNTWNGPFVCDMTTIPCVMNNIAPLPVSGTGLPIAGFDVSLAVDSKGNPHLFTVVGSAAAALDHSVESGLNLDVFDFSYSVAGAAWSATLVDTIYAFRGTIGTGPEGDYTQDNRPQVSTTPDGNKIIFIWSDSPSNPGTNVVPDLIGAAYDVNTQKWTPTINFSSLDPNWAGACTFPSVSPVAISNGGNVTAPVVITKLDVSLDPTKPASFFYFQNITFDGANFNIDKSSCVRPSGINEVRKSDGDIKLYPNPADNLIFVNTPSALDNSIINVYNVLGQLVLTDKMNHNSSYILNTKSFTEGVYTLTLVNGNSVSTKQFVVNH